MDKAAKSLFKKEYFRKEAMMTLREELQGYVSKNIHELVEGKAYALHPNVALDCLFATIKTGNVNITWDRKNQTATFSPQYKRHHQGPFIISYAKLLQGRRNFPPSSIPALLESLEKVLEQMGDVRYYCASQDTIDVLNKDISTYIEKFQEHALLPATNEIPSLTNPVMLFTRTYKKYPKLVETYNQNCHYLGKCPGKREETQQRITKIQQSFWTRYLMLLAKEKGYPLKIEEAGQQAILANGKDALVPGEYIWSFK